MQDKKKFEAKITKDKYGKTVKGLFVDGELLDYSVDIESLKKISALGPEYKKMALADIEKHFCECLSEFVGRHLTKQEIDHAFRTGWI